MKKRSIFLTTIIAGLLLFLAAASAAFAAENTKPSLAFDSLNNRYLAVYVYFDGGTTYSIYGEQLTSDGVPMGAPFSIAAGTADPNNRPVVAFDSAGGNFLVAWVDTRYNGTDIYAQLVKADGSPNGPAVAVSTTQFLQLNPAIAVDMVNHRFLVAWEDYRNGNADIYGQLLKADATTSGAPLHITSALNTQSSPALAFDSSNQRFLVAWKDYRNGNADINGELLNADGTPYNSFFPISTAPSAQSDPCIAFDSIKSRYLVAWQDSRNSLITGLDIYGQLVDAAGVLFGRDIAVSTAAKDQKNAAVAFDAIGRRYLVVWEDYRNYRTGIYGQYLNMDGSFINTDFAVSSAATSHYSPQTAANSTNGNFLVAYESLINYLHDLEFGVVGEALASTPQTWDFGVVTVGNSSSVEVFTITNTDNATGKSIASVGISGTDMADFQIIANGCAAQLLPPHGNCTVTLAFAPRSSGSKSATLSIVSNDPAPLDIPVTGTGDLMAVNIGNAVFSEGFETPDPLTGLPSGWTSVLNSATTVQWRTDNPGNRINQTGGTGKFAVIDSDYAGLVDVDAELRTPILKLSSQATAFLLFKTDFHVYSRNEIADVDVSTNGAAGPWTNVWRKKGSDYPGPKTEVVDISSLAHGQSNVMVRFHYYTANNDWYWEIDEVAVAPAVPVISATPLYKNFAAVGINGPGVSQRFTITNKGGADLSLGQIYFSGSSADYTLQNDSCSTKTLPSSGSCTVDALFRPVSAGAKNAGMDIPSNDPANPVLEATLLGTGAYTITASAGAGGSISSTGAVVVMQGGNQAFTITADALYHISDVLVDNVSIGAVTSYAFNNVTANHTISAVFAINSYVITASAGSNGNIDASATVNYGVSQTIAISPATGYHISDVLVDGVSVGAVTSYTFPNVTANHTISASFAINSYAITASADTGGSISPTGAVNVGFGSSQSFTITPPFGYQVADILVDGVSTGAGNTYTFANVTAAHTIKALFSPSQLSIMTVSLGGASTPATYQSPAASSTSVSAPFSSVASGQPDISIPPQKSEPQEPPREEPRVEPPVYEQVVPVPVAVARLAEVGKAKGEGEKQPKQGGELRCYVKSGVLKRFSEYSGEKTPKGFLSLFGGDESQDVRQEPSISLSDGVSTIRVTVDLGAAGASEPNIILKGVRTMAIGRGRDNSLVVELLPDKGAHEASISLVRDGNITEYPLTVSPKVDVDLSRSGKVTEADFNLFLKERADGKSPRFGLDDNEVRNLTDIYIFTANYIVQSRPKSAKDAKEK